MEVIFSILRWIVNFVLAIISATLMGEFVGLVVVWFFGGPILDILAPMGLIGFKMWEIGAFLGFVGGFFKPQITNFSITQQKPS